MQWVAVFATFIVSHLVGDFALQTDWQARSKYGGLSGPGTARRALCAHVGTYTLAFVPALAWLAGDLRARVLGVALLIAAPHLVQDDGRPVVPGAGDRRQPHRRRDPDRPPERRAARDLAAKDGRDVSGLVDELERGNWDVLAAEAPVGA